MQYNVKKESTGTLKTVMVAVIVAASIITTAEILKPRSPKLMQEEACRSYGEQMGYDVVFDPYNTCFVRLDYGVTVPLDVALDLQKELYAKRMYEDIPKRK